MYLTSGDVCVRVTETGNHLLTVEKVQDKNVIAAAVDSTAFYNYKNVLHKESDNITILHSVGPLPPYAIVCGKHLNGNFIIFYGFDGPLHAVCVILIL